MRFKYNFKRSGADKIPLIDIIIRNKESGKSISYRALLDSGAFACVFHSDIAEVLDINLASIKNQQIFHGVGKAKRNLKGKPYIVEIIVSKRGKSCRFDTCAIFSEDIANTGYPLLGRQGFFDQFSEICFNYTRSKLYLKTKNHQNVSL